MPNENDELEPLVKVEEKPNSLVPEINKVNKDSEFTSNMEKAKVSTLAEASANDVKFVDDVKKELKQAMVKSAQLEKEKQELERKNIEYYQDLIETQKQLNEQKQAVNKWENRQKCREFHYNGVKPMLEFVGITQPMNLFFLYFLTVILIIPYLLHKLIRGTIGVIVSGEEKGNRKKQVVAYLWTLFAVLLTIGAIIGLYYLFKLLF